MQRCQQPLSSCSRCFCFILYSGAHCSSAGKGTPKSKILIPSPQVFEAMDDPPSPLSTSPHSLNSHGTYGTSDGAPHSCAADSRRRSSLDTLNLFRISM